MSKQDLLEFKGKQNPAVLYAARKCKIKEIYSIGGPSAIAAVAYGTKKINNAGSICLGKYAVMAMTDYNIGSNHVLPTNGSAKYSSGISVNEFYKRISYIKLSKKGIESLGPSVITLANYEGLVGHAQSVKKRIRRK